MITIKPDSGYAIDVVMVDGKSDGTSWYSNARAWSLSTGLSEGTDVEGNITREQLAAMLYRYAGSPDVSGLTMGAFGYTDEISAYATVAMLRATQKGIKTGGELDSNGNATRAEVAVMLQRYVSARQDTACIEVNSLHKASELSGLLRCFVLSNIAALD